MQYTKPQIQNVVKASSAIATIGKVGVQQDSNDPSMHNSAPGYEADE
jgi:hypothetical protein